MSPVYVRRTTEVAARVIGGEMMIMSSRDATLFSLNEVASAIWQAADGSAPLEAIVERTVCPQFNVGRDEALADAHEFVQELSTHGILSVSDQPIPSPLPRTAQ